MGWIGKWVGCAPNADGKVRLFCFPYAGGSVAIFRNWASELSNTAEVCPVELPGRGSRFAEEPFHDMRALVSVLSRALCADLTERFALFGHSMGALVAFELARKLRADYGLSPLGLFVSAHGAPSLGLNRPPVHSLPKAKFIKELEREGGTPALLLGNVEMMDVALPSLRADYAAAETYLYREERPLACPIAAFGGMADARVPRSRLLAWRVETSSRFSLRLFPGGHFFLRSCKDELIGAIRTELSEAEAATCVR